MSGSDELGKLDKLLAFWKDRYMRHWCNGNTTALQAEDESSILLCRSKEPLVMSFDNTT